MPKYKVVEKFVSINGEGMLAGQLAIFIRLKGCNLDCSYCDTTWANENDAPYTLMSEFEIYEYIKSENVKNVTLTGGEPLLNDDILSLLKILCDDKTLHIEIETNGSVDLSKFNILDNSPSFTMDYKTPSSNMEDKMFLNNLNMLTKKDTLKFVSGDKTDLICAKNVIDEYNLIGKCNIYISPVFGKIELEEIVDFLIYNNLNGVNLQVQLHKIIWDPNKRGV